MAARRRTRTGAVLIALAVTTSLDGWATAGAAVTQPVLAQLPVTASPPWGEGIVGGFDPDTGQTLMFGGNNVFGQSGDFADNATWQWQASTSAWVQLRPATSPPARERASMAYDAATHQMLMFGGDDPQTGLYRTDTWSWTGSTWVRLMTTAHPAGPQRLVYDGATKQLLAIGSNNTTGAWETWSWSGTAWTKLAPAQQPRNTSRTTAGYDRATNQLIAFSYDSNAVPQVWSWTGTTWRLLPATPSLPPNAAGELVFDAALNELVLVGRNIVNGAIEAWAWSGAGWSLLATVPSPATVSGPVIYNGAQGQLLAFFPLVGSRATPQNQTWVLRAPTATNVAASTTGPATGAGVTLTSTVRASTTVAAAGKVAFFDGTTALAGCAARPLTKGVATCQVTFTVGSHTITAQYLPSTGYLASTSAGLVITAH